MTTKTMTLEERAKALRDKINTPGLHKRHPDGYQVACCLEALREAVAERDREWAATNSDEAIHRAVAEERKALREIIMRDIQLMTFRGEPLIPRSELLAALDAREKP